MAKYRKIAIFTIPKNIWSISREIERVFNLLFSYLMQVSQVLFSVKISLTWHVIFIVFEGGGQS